VKKKKRRTQAAGIPFGAGAVLRAGETVRGCVGDCGDACAPHALRMGTDGALALYAGHDAGGDAVWRAVARRWWRRAPPVADDYWAARDGAALRLGRGRRTLLTRPLARCGPLAALLVGEAAAPRAAASDAGGGDLL